VDLRAGAPPERMAPDVDQLLAGTRQLGEVVEDLLLSTQLQTGTEAGTEVDCGSPGQGATFTVHLPAAPS
jgi:two-component system OmpR family sensor kinase